MPRVRSFVLLVLFAALCVLPSLARSLSPSPAPQPPQPATSSAPASPSSPATVAPVNVRVGAYVIQLGDPDLKDSTFKAVFWLWFRWKGSPDLDPMKKFEVVGGQVEACDNQDKKIVGDETYMVARVRATVTQDFDIARFPLDQHTLEISIEETTDGVEGIRYVADAENSKLQDGISLSGWAMGKPTVAASTKVYASNFGDPSLPSDSQSEYARFTLSVPVRRPGVSYTLKLFWSLYLSVFVALLALHIKPFDLDPRFGLGVGAVFAAMASAYVISSILPDSNQFTLADGVVMSSIAFIVASIIESILSLRLHQCGKERASRCLDLSMFFVFVAAYVAVNLWLFAA